MRKRMYSIGKRATSVVLAAAMAAGLMVTSGVEVQAQYVSGNAPFINSWLVSGPYDTAVADEIYESVIPDNPNLAKSAKTSASSATLSPNPTDYLIDGSTRNQWVTEGTEVPCWAQLSWDEPISVGYMTIALWGDGRHLNKWYDLVFTFADGSVSDKIRVTETGTSAETPAVFAPDETLEDVISVQVIVDDGLSPYPTITGISEIEVYQYNPDTLGTASAATFSTEDENGTTTNIALEATASASSSWQSNAYSYPEKTDSPVARYTADKAIDGNLSTEWIAQMHDTAGSADTWPGWDQEPTLTLTWDGTVTIESFVLYERHNSAWPAGTSNVSEVKYTLKNTAGETVATGTIDGFVADSADPAVCELQEAVTNVKSAEFKIIYDGTKNSNNVGLGFREVEVYGALAPLPEPVQAITPKLGESMTEDGQKWEYFDDRIWNRTYDDYQDLYGYYEVKKGIDTKNKYVYAHTYVYSPVEQQVQFRFGSSGENRLYVNDVAVTAPSKPAEVQKDMVQKTITLKEGWNKILLQIKHTYTDDVNANGVPVAKDNDVYYMGFYGRITDASGNEVDGLSYSVTGTDEALTITTGGLAADDVADDGSTGRGLPENELPIGYTEWPYVWNESQYKNATHNLSASAFRFMADGGQPGYEWSVVDGSLPEGLTLNADGTVDGFVECDPGDYTFTLQVKDAAGATAVKTFTLTVKERPNKWFEEGRVSALSHTGPIYQYFVDPNFSADLWAERASRQGHSMVSVEALQQNYYWPSRFADPAHARQMYLPKDENGQVVDGLKQFEEAVKRYGMKFGLYYATEGGGLQHYSTDVFVQNVEDLILRYDPAYLYFDGPQAMGGANYDVMYSMVRNYSDEIIIDSNAWGTEYGDPDIRTGECSGIYARQTGSKLTKRTVMEPWKSLHTKNNYTPYYARRDDYRLVAQEMICNAGRGMVDNNDQMPIMSRGTNWDSPTDVATRYPKSLQEFIDVREGLAAWFAPEGYSERHESTTGTMPYFLNGSNCSCVDNGGDNLAHFEAGHGPAWGYSTYRDNNIYLHIMKGPDGRTGFSAISDNQLSVSPITDTVEKVIWLNKDEEIPFTQDGETLTIDLTGVEEDQVDTIIKIVTDNETREYKLTNVTVEGQQIAPDQLQLKVEGYMTYQALKANLETVTFTSDNASVAAVDANGMVTPGSNGTTTIHVAGTYEGVTQEDSIQVTAKDGMVYVGEELLGASLWVGGKESYGEFCNLTDLSYRLEGRTEKGGAAGLDAANITMKSGVVDLDGGDKYTPVKIDETDLITFNEDGTLVCGQVSETTRVAVWAEVELDGQTFTTNRVYMDINPYTNLAENAKVTASDSLEGYGAENVTDGKKIEGTEFDASRWSVSGSGASSLTFELKGPSVVNNVAVNFNSKSQNYYNTPKSMEIQVSEDGTEWKTVSKVTPPTAGNGAYFGFANIYTIDPVETQYVRLSFAEGGNSSRLDIMEVAVNGTDLSDCLKDIEAVTKQTSDTTAAVEITGYNGLGEEMDLTDAQIEVTSSNPEIVSVDENYGLTAVSEGRAAITVTVTLGGRTVTKMIYADVDERGILYFGEYLKEVKVTADSTRISATDPANVQIEALLNTGDAADMSNAEVEYIFSDGAPAAKLDGANVIYMPEAIGSSKDFTVQVKVTVNGVSVLSDPLTMTAEGTNAASEADVMVSSVRSRSGAYDGNDQDSRYLGEKAIDGTKSTSWAAKQSDITPWIQLTFAEEKEISKIILVDRGHQVNEIGEGLLEFFDAEGNVVHSQTVTGIQWDGQPDNEVVVETPVAAAKVKFTIDPDQKYYHGGSERPERGLAEFQVVCAQADSNKVESLQTVYAETTVGNVPELPEKVTAIYSDLTTGELDVTWEAVTEEMFAKTGVVKVTGTVEGTEKTAVAEVTVKVNSTQLDALYNTWKDKQNDNYTEESWSALQDALAQAKAVLDNSRAAQEEVDAASAALEDAVRGLEKNEEPAGEANKELLQKTYDYALTLSKDNVVDSAVKAFEEAKAQAKAVLDNPNATQADVDQAWDDLLNGIWGLGIVKGDKTNLEILILKAESMAANRDKYVDTNWQQLEEALQAAKAVYEDGDALAEDIEPAADDLLGAILAQRYKANKTNLKNLVTIAESYDLTQYTAVSAKVLNVALMSARVVLEDESLSTDDQATVDATAEALDAAIQGLEKAKDGEETGDNGDSTGDNGDNTGDNSDNTGNTEENGSGENTNDTGSTGGNNNASNGSNGTSGNTSGSSTSGKTTTSSPKTGDSSNALIWICVMMMALGAAGVTLRKRVRK